MRYGLEIIYYRTPYLWASLPEQYKHQNSVGKFKEKIKNWTYRDMYLPIVPHFWTKFRFYLIFPNYFYPKLNFIKLKKQTNKKRNESIIFTFCFFCLFVFFFHCFYSSISTCKCGLFYLIIIIIIFMTIIFFCFLFSSCTIEGKMKSICNSLL